MLTLPYIPSILCSGQAICTLELFSTQRVVLGNDSSHCTSGNLRCCTLGCPCVYVLMVWTMQVSQHNLANHGDWWSCSIHVSETAFVLDYVLSNTAKKAWDNNNQQVGLSFSCCLPNLVVLLCTRHCLHFTSLLSDQLLCRFRPTPLQVFICCMCPQVCILSSRRWLLFLLLSSRLLLCLSTQEALITLFMMEETSTCCFSMPFYYFPFVITR